MNPDLVLRQPASFCVVAESRPDFMTNIGGMKMHYRTLGRTGWKVSAVSFGAWAIGGTWGSVQDDESMAALNQAVDLGVNFFDTADVYGDGHSERLLARLKRERREEIIIERAGKKIARLSPIESEAPRPMGKLDFRKAAGLGKEIWKDIDVDAYLRQERDEWA